MNGICLGRRCHEMLGICGFLYLVLLCSAREIASGPTCPLAVEDTPKGLALLQSGGSNVAKGRREKTRRSTSSRHVNLMEKSGDLPMLEAFPWGESVRRLRQLTPRSEVSESIWSSGEVKKCGSPCVAHCIAGQPRQFLQAPGIRKALKHRMFDRFSTEHVVFGVFVTSAYHNTAAEEILKDGLSGYARTPVGELQNETIDSLIEAMDDVGVSRALFLNESCHDPSCMENPALQCDANELQLSAQFDARDGKVHHICDVQFKRFQTCMNLIREYELEHGMSFDWVTRSRPDVYWTEPSLHVSELEHQVYVTPWGPAYGAMDWFFAMPRQHADVFSQFSEEASCSQLHHPQILTDCAVALGCECWMASWLYKNNITFQRLPKAPYIVDKFCDEKGCARDWQVNSSSIEER